MDERGHVDQLGRGGGAEGGGPAFGAGAEQDEERAQALAPGREGRADVGIEQLAVAGGLLAEQVLDLTEAAGKPGAGGIEDRSYGRWYGGAGAHPAMPVWIVTMPPARIV